MGPPRFLSWSLTSRLQSKVHHPSLVLGVQLQSIVHNDMCLLVATRKMSVTDTSKRSGPCMPMLGEHKYATLHPVNDGSSCRYESQGVLSTVAITEGGLDIRART